MTSRLHRVKPVILFARQLASGSAGEQAQPPMDMPVSSTDSGTRRNYVTQAPVSEYGRTGGCARCDGKTAPHNNDCRERIVTILTFKGRPASKRVTAYADESAERRVEQARMTDDVMVDPCPAVNTPTRTHHQ